MAQKVTLTDSTSGEIVYPQTLVSSVQNEEGTALESLVLMKDNTTTFSPTDDYNPSTKKYVDDTIAERLASFSGGTAIKVSETQPTSQKTGDFWYKVV